MEVVLAPSLQPAHAHATAAIRWFRANYDYDEDAQPLTLALTSAKQMCASVLKLALVRGSLAFDAQKDATFVYVAALWTRRLKKLIKNALAQEETASPTPTPMHKVSLQHKESARSALLSTLRWAAVRCAERANATPAVKDLRSIAMHADEHDEASNRDSGDDEDALRRHLAHMPPVVPSKRHLGELKGYYYGVRHVRLGREGPPGGVAVLGYHADVSTTCDAKGTWAAHPTRVCIAGVRGAVVQDAWTKLVTKATGHRPRSRLSNEHECASLVLIPDDDGGGDDDCAASVINGEVDGAVQTQLTSGARAVCVLGAPNVLARWLRGTCVREHVREVCVSGHFVVVAE